MKRKTKIFLVDCICFVLLAGWISQTNKVEIEPAEIVEAEKTAETEMILEDDKEQEEKKCFTEHGSITVSFHSIGV